MQMKDHQFLVLHQGKGYLHYTQIYVYLEAYLQAELDPHSNLFNHWEKVEKKPEQVEHLWAFCQEIDWETLLGVNSRPPPTVGSAQMFTGVDIEDLFSQPGRIPPCLHGAVEQVRHGIHWKNQQRTFVPGSLLAAGLPKHSVQEFIFNLTEHKDTRSTVKMMQPGGYSYSCARIKRDFGCPAGLPELCCENAKIEFTHLVSDNLRKRLRKGIQQ